MWPGYRAPNDEVEWTNALLDRPNVMDSMTVKINTQYTKVIFSKRSPSWSLEASEFLLKLWTTSLQEVYMNNVHDEFLSESLEYNMDIAKSISDHVSNLLARMDLQLNVVCLVPFSHQKATTDSTAVV